MPPPSKHPPLLHRPDSPAKPPPLLPRRPCTREPNPGPWQSRSGPHHPPHSRWPWPTRCFRTRQTRRIPRTTPHPRIRPPNLPACCWTKPPRRNRQPLRHLHWLPAMHLAHPARRRRNPIRGRKVPPTALAPRHSPTQSFGCTCSTSHSRPWPCRCASRIHKDFRIQCRAVHRSTSSRPHHTRPSASRCTRRQRNTGCNRWIRPRKSGLAVRCPPPGWRPRPSPRCPRNPWPRTTRLLGLCCHILAGTTRRHGTKRRPKTHRNCPWQRPHPESQARH